MTEAVALRPASWEDVERTIRRVPEYADESRVQLSTETVALDSLRPLCRLARTYRLERVSKLIAACDAARLSPFSGVWFAGESQSPRLIPPPIIEEHSGRLVIIDGLHRLLQAKYAGLRSVSVVVLHGDLARLPADQLTWNEVSLTDHETPRAAKFRNLDDSVFRRIYEHIDQRS